MNPLKTIRSIRLSVCIAGFLATVPVIAQKTPEPGAAGAASQKTSNPFENVPEAKPDQTPRPARLDANIIEAIEFRGARRIPADTLRTLIFSKTGDAYREDKLQRDVAALWRTKRFDDIRLETERGELGGTIVRFVVQERQGARDGK